MIIKWVITEDLENVNIIEFDAEEEAIYGYFEMHINDHIIGFKPDRELLIEEQGNEDILFWLSKLTEGIVLLNSENKYEFPLLSMNIVKLILVKNNSELKVSFVKTDTNEVVWCEQTLFKDWCREIAVNVENFISEIQKINVDLLGAHSIQSLIKMKNTINIFNYDYTLAPPTPKKYS